MKAAQIGHTDQAPRVAEQFSGKIEIPDCIEISVVAIAIILLVIGIIAFLGVADPNSAVKVIGNVFGIKGALGTSITGTILLVIIAVENLWLRTSGFARRTTRIDRVVDNSDSLVQKVEKVNSANPSIEYYVFGNRFKEEHFNPFLNILSKQTGIKFNVVTTYPEGSPLVIIFTFWGRKGGNALENPFPTHPDANLLHVIITKNGNEEKTLGAIHMVYDPMVRDRGQRVEHGDLLKNALENRK